MSLALAAIGIMSAGMIASSERAGALGLGVDVLSCGIHLGTQKVAAFGAAAQSLPLIPSTTISPGDTVGLAIVGNRVVLLVKHAGTEVMRHVLDIATDLPMASSGSWHVAVGFKVRQQSASASELPAFSLYSTLRCNHY